MLASETTYNLSRLISQFNQNNETMDQIGQLLDQLPMAITLTDATAVIQYVNKEFSQVTGYSRQEAIGKKPSFISYKTTPDKIYQELWAQISKGEPWSGHLINKKKDGSRFLAKIQIFPLSDSDKKVIYYLSIQQDITESYEQNIRLKNQHQIFGAVLNTLPSSIALLDENQQVILDNLSYKTLASDLNMEPIQWVIEQEQESQSGSSNTASSIGNLKKTQRRIHHLELVNGSVKRLFQCQFMTLEVNNDLVDHYFSDQKTTGSLLVITEYTREHRLREQQRIQDIRQLTYEAEAMCAMHETTVAALHQLLSPMNVIESAIAVMSAKESESPALNAMKLARESGQTAIDQLRTIQPNSETEVRQSVNLNQLIHETLLIFTEKLMHKGIKLNLDLVPNLPPMTGQPARIRVAIKQIVDNAIDAIELDHPDDRKISVSSILTPDSVLIRVADTGMGVSKKDKNRIFQPFYSTRTQRTSGHKGMGLSIAQQVMSDHQGMIDFSDMSTGDNQVTLVFPIQ